MPLLMDVSTTILLEDDFWGVSLHPSLAVVVHVLVESFAPTLITWFCSVFEKTVGKTTSVMLVERSPGFHDLVSPFEMFLTFVARIPSFCLAIAF